MSSAIEINDSNVDSIIKENKIVMIDFFATWCGPCRMLGPIIDELYNENTDITIGKLNVDNNRDTAVTYGVRGIPTIIFFKDGEVVDKMVGLTTKENLVNKINSLK